MLNGMSWMEKAGPGRAAVIKRYSFLQQWSAALQQCSETGMITGEGRPGAQSLTAPAVTPAAT
ncbi:hypothetical protein GCM10010307_29310 [Streptomyces vastus]|uniref:Integrase n=1 Tax=Streptomyces vastus TaxID=285451 RepID=A0ABN3QSN9_9ACTN